MLIGEYTSKLQDKNRVSMPKKFRSEIGEKIIITKGYEECLIVVPFDKWEEMIKGIVSRPFTMTNVRDTSRFILGSAVEVLLDDQGRFVINPTLAEHAGLNSDVSFLGLVNWIEVWDTSRWKEREKYLRDSGSSIADELSKLDVS
jgi:MraZ protein